MDIYQMSQINLKPLFNDLNSDLIIKYSIDFRPFLDIIKLVCLTYFITGKLLSIIFFYIFLFLKFL